MSSKPRTLGVIPARAGSKRVPRKNLKNLCGLPLIAHTIKAAQEAESLDTFVVSTECQTIGQVANSFGAYVIKRPEELAGDEATSGSVCVHALNWMGADDYDLVCLLHPTSPIRSPKHIDQAISQLWASSAPCLASVKSEKRAYIHNASIYVMRSEWLLATENHYCEESIPFLMDKAHSVDINDEFDFATAEWYLNQSEKSE